MTQTPHFTFIQWLMLPLLLFIWWAGFRYSEEMLWYDEYWSYHYAFGDRSLEVLAPTDVIRRVLDAGTWERHPPGYYLLLNLAGRLFGTSEACLRYLSLFASLLSLAWAYQLGKIITCSQVGGFGGAFTLGMNNFFIHYAHDARMYALVIVCMCATLATYWQLTNTKRLMRGARLIFVISLFWGMFSLYAVGISWVFLGIYHLLFASKKRRWFQTLVLMGIAVIGIMAWVGFYLVNQPHPGRPLPGASAPPIVLIRTFSHSYTNDAPLLLGILIGYALLHARPFARKTLWLITLAGGTLIGLLLLSRFTPFYHIRAMITLFPFIALIGAFAYGVMHHTYARYG